MVGISTLQDKNIKSIISIYLNQLDSYIMLLINIIAFLLLAESCNAFRKLSISKIFLPSTIQSKTSAFAQFKNFDDMLEKVEVPVLVDFFAQWCGPCVMMQPVLEEVAGRLGDDAKVAKVDTDKSPRLGSRYQVEALPTLILFNKGKEVERFVGYRSANDLEKEVRMVIKRIQSAPSA